MTIGPKPTDSEKKHWPTAAYQVCVYNKKTKKYDGSVFFVVIQHTHIIVGYCSKETLNGKLTDEKGKKGQLRRL